MARFPMQPMTQSGPSRNQPRGYWLIQFFRILFSISAVACAIAALVAVALVVRFLATQPLGRARTWFAVMFALAVACGLGASAGEQWISGRLHSPNGLRPWRRIFFWSWTVGMVAIALAWATS
jgi:hypothetical protein